MAAEQQQDVYGVPVWMRNAAKCEQVQGLQVLVPANRPATWKDASGGMHRFKKSEKRQRFKFMAQCCMQGKQHFKLSTPAALTDPTKLLCCFCANMTGAWTASNRHALPPAELSFIQLLWQQQQSEDWCFQVQLPGWRGRCDFYNWQRDVYLQVDDWYHFSNDCNNDAFSRDLHCNIVARSGSLPLVRVHHADLRRPDVVLAAVEYASQNKGVVFTASYVLDGRAHVNALWLAVHGSTAPRADAFGNLLV